MLLYGTVSRGLNDAPSPVWLFCTFCTFCTFSVLHVLHILHVFSLARFAYRSVYRRTYQLHTHGTTAAPLGFILLTTLGKAVAYQTLSLLNSTGNSRLVVNGRSLRRLWPFCCRAEYCMIRVCMKDIPLLGQFASSLLWKTVEPQATEKSETKRQNHSFPSTQS